MITSGERTLLPDPQRSHSLDISGGTPLISSMSSLVAGLSYQHMGSPFQRAQWPLVGIISLGGERKDALRSIGLRLGLGLGPCVSPRSPLPPEQICSLKIADLWQRERIEKERGREKKREGEREVGR